VVLENASQAGASVTFGSWRLATRCGILSADATHSRGSLATRHDGTHFRLNLARTVRAPSPRNGASESGHVAPTFAVDLGNKSGTKPTSRAGPRQQGFLGTKTGQK